SICCCSCRLGLVGWPPLGRYLLQACCAALHLGSLGPLLPRRAVNSWLTPFPLNCGSGRLMPCWRMPRANASAACIASCLLHGLAVVVAVGLLAPPRLATPLALPPPPQAATVSVRASTAPSSPRSCRQRRGGAGGRA